MTRSLVLAVVAALALPATAAAHSHTSTVALDYRLRLEPAVLPGVRLRILDGDRDLQARVSPGSSLIVRGYLREGMIRIGADGVWVNASSPTAQSDKLVNASSGWVKVRGGRTYAWHDHRLAPPPTPTGRNAFPLTVNGRNRTVAVLFMRVPRPALWPWLGGAVLFAGGVWAAMRVRGLRAPLTLGLALAGGVAAVVASITFALRDQPSGNSGWFQVTATIVIAVLLSVLLARSSPRRRAHAAGIVGAVAAAGTIAFLPVFWHGVIVSALPAAAARLACALALLCGATAAGLSFLPDFDEPRPAR
jgi:hypothetical protein